MDINEKKKNRFQFLKRLYEITDGNPSHSVDGAEIGKELGLDKAESNNIYNYLIGEGLVEPMGAGLRIVMTHIGVLEIEEALSNPTKPTEHFPAFNVINIHSMNNSVIQQGSHGSTQTVSSLNQEVVPDLKNFLSELKASIDKLNLSLELKNEMIAEMQTAEIQVNSPKPKPSIIKESLTTIRTILEGIAIESLAPVLIEKVKLLIPLIV